MHIESPRPRDWEGDAKEPSGFEGEAQNSTRGRDEAARESSAEGSAPGSDARKAQKSSPPSARALRPERSDESDGYAATGIGERTNNPVHWVRFEEDPTPVARVSLRYEFHRELVRLGILPRGGDTLFGREHATGFSREYAPDPDRHR